MSQNEVQKDLFGNDTAIVRWKEDDEGESTGRGVQVIEKEDIYLLTEFRKTGAKSVLEIPKDNVRILRNIIRSEIAVGDTKDSKVIIMRLVETKRLHIKERMAKELMASLFGGGPFRSKYYFPMLYRPLKILDYFQEVEHKQGKIKRLK